MWILGEYQLDFLAEAAHQQIGRCLVKQGAHRVHRVAERVSERVQRQGHVS